MSFQCCHLLLSFSFKLRLSWLLAWHVICLTSGHLEIWKAGVIWIFYHSWTSLMTSPMWKWYTNSLPPGQVEVQASCHQDHPVWEGSRVPLLPSDRRLLPGREGHTVRTPALLPASSASALAGRVGAGLVPLVQGEVPATRCSPLTHRGGSHYHLARAKVQLFTRTSLKMPRAVLGCSVTDWQRRPKV